MKELENSHSSDKIITRYSLNILGKKVTFGEKTLMDELPKGSANYGARPEGYFSPSPVLPEEISRLDLTKVSSNGNSKVTIESKKVGKNPIEVPLIDGIGSKRIKIGKEIVVYAEDLTERVKELETSKKMRKKGDLDENRMQSFSAAPEPKKKRKFF